MAVVRAESLKLKRSLSWTVAILLPLAMVLSGAANTLAAGEQLADGWHTLWLRSVVVHGLFPLAVGIGILASLVWRAEHRGGNWNALMSGPTSSLRIVAAKAAVVAALAAVMQGILLLAIVAVGKWVFGLPGLPPVEYLGISVLIALASAPVAALQSGLSLFLRSFAAPVAVALLGAGLSVVLLLAELPGVIFVLPYALAGRATQLGTGALADTGAVTSADVLSILGAAVLLSAVVVTLTSNALDRRDT